MKKLLRLNALAVLLLLSAGPALAAESASPWYDFWGKTVNLALLVAIIWYFARKPVGAALRVTAQHVKDLVDRHRNEAERSGHEMAQQKQQLMDLQSELDRMLVEARKDGERERERLMAEAQQWAEHFKSQTKVQIEQEVRKVRQELRAELAGHTVRLAEERIRTQMTPDHQKRLVADFISQLEARS